MPSKLRLGATAPRGSHVFETALACTCRSYTAPSFSVTGAKRSINRRAPQPHCAWCGALVAIRSLKVCVAVGPKLALGDVLGAFGP